MCKNCHIMTPFCSIGDDSAIELWNTKREYDEYTEILNTIDQLIKEGQDLIVNDEKINHCFTKIKYELLKLKHISFIKDIDKHHKNID